MLAFDATSAIQLNKTLVHSILHIMARDSHDRLEPDDVLNAYALGYFPMARARDDSSIVWVLPDFRGVLDLTQARAPKKLMRFLRREPFEVRINTAFTDVIAACAASAKGREDTWINASIEEAYTELHQRGWAHSVECYRDNQLVGGLYGVSIGAVFCGESMFSRADNSSKVAMLYLISLLKQNGYALLDTQFYTDHLAQFGVEEWPDVKYQLMLKDLVKCETRFATPTHWLSAATVSQSITHTS